MSSVTASNAAPPPAAAQAPAGGEEEEAHGNEGVLQSNIDKFDTPRVPMFAMEKCSGNLAKKEGCRNSWVKTLIAERGSPSLTYT